MSVAVKRSDPRHALEAVFTAGILAAHGKTLITARSSFDGQAWRYHHGPTRVDWTIPPAGRLIVIGAGKAAASMAQGLEAVLGSRIDAGAVIVKYDHRAPLDHIAQYEAGHPIPDAAGIAATQKLLGLVDSLRAEDRVFVLLSGGASALLVAPVAGLDLAPKAAITAQMMRSGAAIETINAIRRRLSTVKGGGLLRAIGPAACMTLVISDVEGSDPALIGSGPTWPGQGGIEGVDVLALLAQHGALGLLPEAVKTSLSNPQGAGAPASAANPLIMLADSGTALDAAASQARSLGYDVEIFSSELIGETHEAARRFADRLLALQGQGGGKRALLAAGETTLQVAGNGRGGRAQEFALVVAAAIAGRPGIAVLAAGTDGTDGPTDAAGAFADGGTAAAARHHGFDLADVLRNNDSYTLFSALGASFRPGPTGTNVRDLICGLVDA